MAKNSTTQRSRLPRIIGGVVALGVIVAAVVLIYIYVSGGSGEVSQAISAPELTTEPEAVTESATVFNIVPEESLVSFTLEEDLRGSRVTVVGTTNQVAGQLLVDFAEPTNSQVGTIRINVRSLATDNDFRNRAIRGQILLSAQDEYEFSEFVPTSVVGLPETVTIGEPITFQIVGNLTLRGITGEVTFDAAVTPVSETRLQGSATATVQRATWQLNIPNVPGVANVTEDVQLAINFVALAAEGA